MTPDEEAHVLRTVTRIGTKMDALISDDHATGVVPELKLKVDRHDSQISYWKGAIAVVAVLMLALGGVIFAHVMGGKP